MNSQPRKPTGYFNPEATPIVFSPDIPPTIPTSLFTNSPDVTQTPQTVLNSPSRTVMKREKRQTLALSAQRMLMNDQEDAGYDTLRHTSSRKLFKEKPSKKSKKKVNKIKGAYNVDQL